MNQVPPGWGRLSKREKTTFLLGLLEQRDQNSFVAGGQLMRVTGCEMNEDTPVKITFKSFVPGGHAVTRTYILKEDS